MLASLKKRPGPFATGGPHSEDCGGLDAEGYAFIVDRKNDMIISGRKDTYPRENEEVIYTTMRSWRLLSLEYRTNTGENRPRP